MINKIHDYLTKFDVKPSPQRVAVMEYLMTHSNHPSAEQIYEVLLPSMPTLSKMTVYNTLKLLAEKHAILALNIDEKQMRFDGDTSQHAHFICEACGKVEDIRLYDNSFIEVNAPNEFKINDVQLLYKGICKCCIKNNN